MDNNVDNMHVMDSNMHSNMNNIDNNMGTIMNNDMHTNMDNIDNDMDTIMLNNMHSNMHNSHNDNMHFNNDFFKSIIKQAYYNVDNLNMNIDIIIVL